jgi:hypothetical protein
MESPSDPKSEIMKKLIFLFVLLFLQNAAILAQGSLKGTATTNTMITDTLHYYFNKQYFKTNPPNLKSMPYFKSTAATVNNATLVTFVGSRFDVPNTHTVEVFGLEAYVAQQSLFVSNRPFRLYLFSLDANGLPLDSIDSVDLIAPPVTATTPSLIGANFKSKVTGNPVSHVMTKDFAVLMRNISGDEKDTVLLLRTSAKAATNVNALPKEKFGEGGYGFIMYNKVFYKTTNYNMSLGFGAGTDYEFCVAPRVKYEIYADHIVPPAIANNATVCTRTAFTFTNNSSPFYLNRQYNLLEFYRHWQGGSFMTSPPGGWSPESPITWFFEYDDNTIPPRDPRKVLPEGETTVTSETDLAGCFSSNSLRARLAKMTPYGKGEIFYYNQDFTICMDFCNGDAVGITSHQAIENIRIYPNPTINGMAFVSGMNGKTEINIYNMLGEKIDHFITQSSNVSIDLQNQPQGVYFIKTQNASTGEKILKLVKQ